MGEAVGIDLGTAVSAAARRQGDDVEPRLLLPTADVAPPGDTRAALAALATRAGGGAEVPPSVGVAVPVHDPSAGAELEAAARDVFGDPLIVPRPVAVAAWFRHVQDVHPDGLVVVVEADDDAAGPAATVCIVGSRPAGAVVVGRPAGGLLGTNDPVRDAVDMAALAIRSARVTPTDLDVAVVVGGAPWLDALAEGIEELADLAAVVDPDPQLAVACGAALLAGETGRGGGGAAVALGSSLLGAAALATPTAGAPVGSGAGMAVGEAVSGVGTGAGGAAADLAGTKAAPAGGELGPGDAGGGLDGGEGLAAGSDGGLGGGESAATRGARRCRRAGSVRGPSVGRRGWRVRSGEGRAR